MPHLLIAGLLERRDRGSASVLSPEHLCFSVRRRSLCRFDRVIDPKMLELSVYADGVI